jgi:antitoxin (DNA-binding transcriptional repressor) of toxin-antitoxin stability system
VSTIPQKELRNNVGEVFRRAESGERITVAGRPLAELGHGEASLGDQAGARRDLDDAGP